MAGPAAATPGSAASGVLELVPENGPMERQIGAAGKEALNQTPPGQRLLDTGPSTMAEAGSCASSEVRFTYTVFNLI